MKTWRTEVRAIDQLFLAGGRTVQGGLSLGGALTSYPEPGGRAYLRMGFAPLASRSANVAASWTMTAIRNGQQFVMAVQRSVQLVPDADLGAPSSGLLWSGSLTWSNGKRWQSRPVAKATFRSRSGTTTLVVDLTPYGQVIQPGHIIGVTIGANEFAHMVEDVEVVGANTRLTVNPPLRRRIDVGTLVNFRPKMAVTCRNPDETAAMFREGRSVSLGEAEFAEVLV